MASGERVYLLADMHLKPLDAPRAKAREMAVAENERLARFLASIEGTGSLLVLLGDTFNFWFERRSHVVGDYYTALSLFKLASEKGMEIHHVSGNRDYAVGEGLGYDPATRYHGFLRLRRGFTVSRLADFGIEPHGPRYRFHQAGRSVACIHGDSLCRKDKAFMALRWILQGPVGRTVMRWAPWSFLEMLVSGQQARTKMRKSDPKAGEMFEESAIRKEMALGGELLLCGHIHTHYEREVELVGKPCRLVALPPWLEGWYGVMEDGELRIERFE